MTEQSPRKNKRRSNHKKNKEAELAREIAKVALSQHESSANGRPAMLERSMKDKRKMELAQAVADYEEKKVDSTKYGMIEEQSDLKSSPEVQRTDSGVSLEYSLDSSLLGENSTLAGQSFAADGSVASSRRRSKNKVPTKPMSIDDDMRSAISIASAMTEVPTDEELFAVGWAKALDPKSGSHYYFTLDRTKIVWDNPLLDTASAVSPDTAAAI